jgi:hypothetical protein
MFLRGRLAAIVFVPKLLTTRRGAQILAGITTEIPQIRKYSKQIGMAITAATID